MLNAYIAEEVEEGGILLLPVLIDIFTATAEDFVVIYEFEYKKRLAVELVHLAACYRDASYMKGRTVFTIAPEGYRPMPPLRTYVLERDISE